MRLLEHLSWVVGLMSYPVIQWRAGRSALNASPMPIGTPPVDYTVLNQAQLLASFSDAVGRNGITPRSMRDFVGSTITNTGGGAVSSVPLPLPGWTTATRPDMTGLAGPAIGFNYDLQQLDMWNDHTQSWVNPSFQGGTVAGDTTFNGIVTFANPGNNVISGNLEVGGNVGINGGLVVHYTIICSNMPTAPASGFQGMLWDNGGIVNIQHTP